MAENVALPLILRGARRDDGAADGDFSMSIIRAAAGLHAEGDGGEDGLDALATAALGRRRRLVHAPDPAPRSVVPADADEAVLERIAKDDGSVAKHLDGKAIRKTIVVKGKLVNFIVG